MGTTVMYRKDVPVIHVTVMFKELWESKHQRGEREFFYLFRNSFNGKLRIIKHKHA